MPSLSQLEHLKTHLKIDTIVQLCFDNEFQTFFHEHVLQKYNEKKFKILKFPIRDFNIPISKEKTQELITKILEETQAGKNVLIHCVGGNGRTGLILACLARRVFNFSGTEAVKWIRQYVPTAVERSNQTSFVNCCLLDEPEPKNENDWGYPSYYDYDGRLSRSDSRVLAEKSPRTISSSSRKPSKQTLPREKTASNGSLTIAAHEDSETSEKNGASSTFHSSSKPPSPSKLWRRPHSKSVHDEPNYKTQDSHLKSEVEEEEAMQSQSVPASNQRSNVNRQLSKQPAAIVPLPGTDESQKEKTDQDCAAPKAEAEPETNAKKDAKQEEAGQEREKTTCCDHCIIS